MFLGTTRPMMAICFIRNGFVAQASLVWTFSCSTRRSASEFCLSCLQVLAHVPTCHQFVSASIICAQECGRTYLQVRMRELEHMPLRQGLLNFCFVFQGMNVSMFLLNRTRDHVTSRRAVIGGGCLGSNLQLVV